MTVNLLQMDHAGKEKISPLFMSDEDRETMEWLYSLEAAASGTTIFVHRLSDPGHYLCTVPCAHMRFAGDPEQPVRYCGCYDCIDQRDFLRDYVVRFIASMERMEELFPESFRLSVMYEEIRKAKELAETYTARVYINDMEALVGLNLFQEYAQRRERRFSDAT